MSQLKKYEKSQVLTASNSELILLLYQKVIKNLKQSQNENTPLEIRNKNIIKSIEILQELDLSLEEKNNPELTKNLKIVYTYCIQKLSNALKDKSIINEALNLIENLYTNWVKALK